MGVAAARLTGGGAGGADAEDDEPTPPRRPPMLRESDGVVTLSHPALYLRPAFGSPGCRQAARAIKPRYTCEATLFGHNDDIYALAVFPDGSRIVSGDYSGVVKVWDKRTGKAQTVQAHTGTILGLAVTPDGLVLTASTDERIRCWSTDKRTPRCLVTMNGHDGCVSSVAALAGGDRIVSGSWDDEIKTWDLKTGRCLTTLDADSGGVFSIAVMPGNGDRLVSGGNPVVKVWDLAVGHCVASFDGHTAHVACVAALDSDRVVSGSVDNHVKVWSVSEGCCLQTHDGVSGSVEGVCCLPNGNIASCGEDGLIKLYGRRCLQMMAGHQGSTYAIAALPDGRLCSASTDHTVKIWHDAQRAAEKYTAKQIARQLACCDVAETVLKFL